MAVAVVWQDNPGNVLHEGDRAGPPFCDSAPGLVEQWLRIGRVTQIQ